MENCEIRALAIDLISQNLRSTPSDLLFLLLYGLDLNQAEVGSQLDCNQSTIGRRHDRQIAKLAQALYLSHHKLPATTQLSIEILDEYSKYLKSLCEDYYVQVVIDLLTSVKPKSTIVNEFIDLLETHWEFRFKPGGAGLTKVDAFVRQRFSTPISHLKNVPS